jgi:hypothetical protein
MLVSVLWPASAGDGLIAVTGSCGRGNACIFIMDQKGMHKRPVYRTDRSGPIALIGSLSPDHRSIALADRGDLYRVGTDRLTVHPDGIPVAPREGEFWNGAEWAGYSGLSHPAWAPRGGLIAVKTIEPQAVCVIDEWGANELEAVYLPPEGTRLHGGGLAWNSDGTRLAFFLAVGRGVHDLIILDLVDGAAERISPEDIGAPPGWFHPSWARGGDPRILFCAGDWIHAYDTKRGELAAHLTEGRWPAWSPDNSEIALRKQLGKLYSFNLKTGKLRSLGDGSFPCWSRSFEAAECAGDPDCKRGLCCSGACVEPCESDTDCDDAEVGTDDYCLYAGSCDAYCYYLSN